MSASIPGGAATSCLHVLPVGFSAPPEEGAAASAPLGAGAAFVLSGARAAAAAARGPGHGVKRTAAGLTLTHEVREEHLASHKRKAKAELRKSIVCAVMFVVATAAQVYMGVKCISFDCDWERRPTLRLVQTTLFLATLALVNFESFLAKRMVMVHTQQPGFFVPEFHPHRLFFHPNRVPSTFLFNSKESPIDAGAVGDDDQE